MQKLSVAGIPVGAFSILLSSDPAPAEKTAAAYLQRIFRAACGAAVPIADQPAAHNIRIGAGSREGIRLDGFRISACGGDLFLRGRIPRGTLYAAYDFTEEFLGVRSFASDVERIPSEGTSDVPDGYEKLDNPIFEQRLADWISYSRCAEHASRARITGYGAVAEEYGGASNLNAGCHTFLSLCPPEQYFEEHPEYYSFWEGRRIPAGQDGHNPPVGQLCLTNPDVLRIVTENVLDRLRKNPGVRVIDVSQNDNSRYCCCEKCAAVDAEEESHSGTIIRFVNAVAEAVEKEFPEVLVQTFAYQYSRKPPRLTKPRKNVLIRYCTIEACFRHPLNDPDCPVNGGVFGKELAGWGKISTQMSIWDYTTNYNCFMTPFPNLYSLHANARLFADSHALGVFEEDIPSTYAGEFGELRAYLAGRLLWNPRMSGEEFERHMTEFLAAYYGPGWPALYRYIQIQMEATKDADVLCFDRTGDAMCDLCTPDDCEYYVPKAYQPTCPDTFLAGLIARLDEVKPLWDEAFRLAETDIQRKHLERSRLSLTYTELFCKPHAREAMSAEERTDYEAAVETYYRDAERFGCDTNLFTSRKTARDRGGKLRPADRADT